MGHRVALDSRMGYLAVTFSDRVTVAVFEKNSAQYGIKIDILSIYRCIILKLRPDHNKTR